MNLVSIDSVSKNVKETPLFTDVSFGIDDGDHIGFVGPNGSGKSTFLQLLTGELSCDTGTIAFNRELTMSVLDQRPTFDNDDTLLSFLYKGTDPLLKLAGEYAACVQLVSSQEKSILGLQQRLAALTHQMEERKGFSIEHTYESLLSELGICGGIHTGGLTQKMAEMSGGMVKKAALARAFTANSRLLLLDEPTNHLDIDTIEWLEKRLADFSGSFILITHDRYFLDSVCNVMLDIDRCKINKYDGNFSSYLRRKKERAEEEARHDAHREAILSVELEWLKRGPKARALKDSHRKARAEAMLAERHTQDAQMESFSACGRRMGGKILKIQDVVKNWPQANGSVLEVIKSFSYEFSKGERIGIIGPNGSGKSTFLDIIAGRTDATAGLLDCGTNTVIGYFDQTARFIDRSQTVLEYMHALAQSVQLKDGSTCSIEQFLERFLFPHEMFNQQLAYLSGGELRRLQLIQILAAAPNFLLFDEPTNDFDIATISLLENFLQDFDGCILAVSHDRAFLDNVTDFLFVFDGEGNVSCFTGGYADYRAYILEKAEEAQAVSTVTKAQAGGEEPTGEESSSGAQSGEVRKRKLSFKEKKEFDGLLDEISALEDEKNELETYFSSAAFATGGADSSIKQARYEDLGCLIEAKILRWEELSAFTD